jgi:hypothetical protein
MLLILGSLFLPFAARMASQAKEVEMLSTEELQRNQQLISQIYILPKRNFPLKSSLRHMLSPAVKC